MTLALSTAASDPFRSERQQPLGCGENRGQGRSPLRASGGHVPYRPLGDVADPRGRGGLWNEGACRADCSATVPGMPAFVSWSVAGGLPVTRKRGGSIVSSSPRRHLIAFVLSGEKTARARVGRSGGRARLRPGPPGSPRPGGFTWWLYSPAGPPGEAPTAWRPFLSTCTHRVCVKNPPHFRSARNDTLKVIPKSSGGRGRRAAAAGRAGRGPARTSGPTRGPTRRVAVVPGDSTGATLLPPGLRGSP